MGLISRWSKSAVTVGFALSVLLLVGGWGSTGHHIINGEVVVDLPVSMRFFISNAGFLAQHASDPDNRKGQDSQKPFILKEGPRHFIDLERFPQFSSRSIPEDFSAVIAAYDSATVFDIGIVPWAAVWSMDSLTAQLKRGDTLHALQSAADLGHYVGDAHQPLHATEYFGTGTYSDRPGSNSGNIHSRYESTMISDFQSQLGTVADSVEYVSNPIDFMFKIVYESNSYVDSIYDADMYARQVTGWNGSSSPPQSYYDTLWSRTCGFTRLQFQRAELRYADLLYTAWVNAFGTATTGIPATLVSSSYPDGFWLGQNYPNPFNPTTTIRYRVPLSGNVDLTVYNVQGKQVAILEKGNRNAGEYASVFDGTGLSSGVYVYRLRISSGHTVLTTSRKLVLLK